MTSQAYRSKTMWIETDGDDGKPLHVPAFRVGLAVTGASLIEHDLLCFVTEYRFRPFSDGSFAIDSRTILAGMSAEDMVAALQEFDTPAGGRLCFDDIAPSAAQAFALSRHEHAGTPHIAAHPIVAGRAALREKQEKLRQLGRRHRLKDGPA